MELSIYQIDAFSSSPFLGNPAAVMPLDHWLPDEKLQKIANENNLSETAFFVKSGDRFELRWFTPKAEVELCGHATLATAYVIFKEMDFDGDLITFDTRYKGLLYVKQDEGYLVMDFPAYNIEKKKNYSLPAELQPVPISVFNNPYLIFEFEKESQVVSFQPDLQMISEIHPVGVAITAPGNAAEIDFVSRFFVPNLGIPEDPATGSLQVALASIWSEKLDRDVLRSRQLSERGGDFWIELRGDRVLIKGQAVKVLEGKVYL